jgi:hypothetical protein
MLPTTASRAALRARGSSTQTRQHAPRQGAHHNTPPASPNHHTPGRRDLAGWQQQHQPLWLQLVLAHGAPLNRERERRARVLVEKLVLGPHIHNHRRLAGAAAACRSSLRLLLLGRLLLLLLLLGAALWRLGCRRPHRCVRPLLCCQRVCVHTRHEQVLVELETVATLLHTRAAVGSGGAMTLGVCWAAGGSSHARDKHTTHAP